MQQNKEFTYDKIIQKIESLKRQYIHLREKSLDYCFSALCIKNNFYKNPALNFDESIFSDAIVDGVSDGGVDILLTDPNSDASDFAICQSKLHKEISYEEIANALHKMIDFYKNMNNGQYQTVNKKVQNRFITLNCEVGDESKIIFVFYTSANKNGIKISRLQKLLDDELNDPSKFELRIYFGDGIIDEINEAESRRPYVEKGELNIDKTNNVLFYNDEDSAIVNISAFSLKELFALHNTNLLSRNLRYFIKKKDIDESVNKTIKESPETFWYKNNGITIICDKFEISGNLLKLTNFSIVNGGQTTTLIHKSENISKEKDLFLPCKVITIVGNSIDEKNNFALEVAKAANSQKAIKAIDLKANAPEQIRFSNCMREVGVFYQTKRGETIPKDYKTEYLNSDLSEIGKLCLAGIYQLPATSRSKPSTLFNDRYYNNIFNSDQKLYANVSRDLLYVDYYFRKTFLKEFQRNPDNSSRNMAFVSNSRTICLSFATLASRYVNNNIDSSILSQALKNIKKDNFYDDYLYKIFQNTKGMKSIFNSECFNDNKTLIDKVLYELFDKLIYEGEKAFNMVKEENDALNETNYLKKDLNYFQILKNSWLDFKKIFDKNALIFVNK